MCPATVSLSYFPQAGLSPDYPSPLVCAWPTARHLWQPALVPPSPMMGYWVPLLCAPTSCRFCHHHLRKVLESCVCTLNGLGNKTYFIILSTQAEINMYDFKRIYQERNFCFCLFCLWIVHLFLAQGGHHTSFVLGKAGPCCQF